MVTVIQTQPVPLSPQCMALSHIVTCHILHAAFHLSPVTCRMSLSLNATATDPPHGNAMQRPKIKINSVRRSKTIFEPKLLILRPRSFHYFSLSFFVVVINHFDVNKWES